MSAPTPAPGDDRPREGFYPDPSIPGYVRYWNGAAWVPGTSRPAPSDGEPLTPPPGSGPAPSPVEETGPHFFDEDPQPPSVDSQHGNRPEPASAWAADRSRQSGFGGDQDRRVSWGAAAGTDPRIPSDTTTGDGTATIPPADSGGAASGNTFVFRRPTAGGGAAGTAAPGTAGAGGAGASGGPAFNGPGASGASGAAGPGGNSASGPGGSGGPASGGSPSGAPGSGTPGAPGSGTHGAPGSGAPGGPAFGAAASAAGRPAGGATPGVPAPGGPVSDEGTMTFRAVSQRTPQQGGAQGGGTGGARSDRAAGPGFGPQAAPGAGSVTGGPAGPQPAPGAPGAPGFGAGMAAAERAAAAQAQAPAPSVPAQPTPMSSGAGGGQPSWAQQVHRLAGAPGEDQPVAPWKPPVDDIFQAAARRQAAARPAGLGKRLTARLLDTLVLVGVTAAAAVPLGTKALDHVNEKIDAAKLSGETVTVWLLDGTTSAYLGIVLAVLLLFGVLYEALPTAKWGRTLGKKLLGLEVRDIEGGEPPSFGAALRRWLVYSVPGLLAVGVVGVVWGLFDKPWRQCWHDKAAHTFVAG
ncbi:RDD family protein [Streptomyces sp. S.PB5]|uniref:RDD family protein n=1 Tax=Streptomyces sp. S.PB5 TaxID=3020844 RepID=UPI0025B04722|nr:RDD family protein [Streptomyces sp. S.PB5]MDN3022536.1 RDD family protein [Streptomyces sp. S.PB5]